MVRAASGTEPMGVVVTLHGANADPAWYARVWEAAVPEEWMVMTPVGLVPTTLNRWSWPLDSGESVDAVLGQLPKLAWDERVVLCGYSQGGRVALELAARVPSPHGLVLIAPAIRTEALPPVPDQPTFAYLGEQDWALAGVDLLAEEMVKRGTPVHVERISGIGHAMPQELAPILEHALDWIDESHTT
jgi:pimeloyl-ACP methyl ester carboxylesterase